MPACLFVFAALPCGLPENEKFAAAKRPGGPLFGQLFPSRRFGRSDYRRISHTAKNGNGRARKSDKRPARAAPPAVPFDGFEIDWRSESAAVRADLALFVARGGRMTLVMGKGNGVAAPGNGKGERLGLASIVATIDLSSPDWLALAALMEGKWRVVKLARERGARVRYRIERHEPGGAWLEVPSAGSAKVPSI